MIRIEKSSAAGHQRNHVDSAGTDVDAAENIDAADVTRADTRADRGAADVACTSAHTCIGAAGGTDARVGGAGGRTANRANKIGRASGRESAPRGDASIQIYTIVDHAVV